MKIRNLLLVSLLSVFACGAHAVLLNTQFNHYFYSSALKIVLFAACPLVYFMISNVGRLKDLFFNRFSDLNRNNSQKNKLFKSLITARMRCARRSRVRDKRVGRIHFARKRAVPMGCGAAPHVSKKGLKLSFMLGLFVFVFIWIVFFAFRSLLDQSMVTNALSNVGITSANYPLALLYVIFINAALEEMFFRGFLFLNLSRMTFTRYAHVFSSLLFALYHVSVLKTGVTPGVLFIAIIGLFFAGLIFNVLAKRCESIVGSLVVHASANLAIGLIGIQYL